MMWYVNQTCKHTMNVLVQNLTWELDYTADEVFMVKGVLGAGDRLADSSRSISRWSSCLSFRRWLLAGLASL